MLARNPAAAYRRVALDARIEAAGSAELTRICLEEVQAALGTVLTPLAAFSTSVEGSLAAHRAALVRAQSVLVWLARSVAPDHPLGDSLRQFYGGLAQQVGASILQPDAGVIAQVRSDISDLLAATQKQAGNVPRGTI
jgi:hypothetical protein